MEREGINQDIISNLNEDILHHILSFLDMRQVIQTSILSTRWRYLWKSLPFLKFDCREYHRHRPYTNFHDFFDNVISIRDKSSEIKSIRFSCNVYYCSCFKRINTVVNELYDRVPLKGRVPPSPKRRKKDQLPHNLLLLAFQSLNILELIGTNRHVYIPDSMTLPSLTKLVLTNIRLKSNDDDALKKIFSSCPMLESLSLLDCLLDNTIFDISSPQLKHLVLDIDRVKKYIKLCTPNLISFESIFRPSYRGDRGETQKVRLGTCNSLKTLKLHCHRFSLKSTTLSSLQKLVLQWVDFDDKGDVIQKIFLGCPVLESLSIKYCKLDQDILYISSLQLKHLLLLECGDSEYIKLNAPNLISFCCRGVKWKYFDVTGSLHALVEAEIDLGGAIDEQYIPDCPSNCPPVIDEVTRKFYTLELIKILKAFYNVEILTPSVLFFQILSQARSFLEESNTILEFTNLKRLNLSVWLLKNCTAAILYLLMICPKIEFLHLTEVSQNYERTQPLFSSLQCMLYHLRYIKIEHMNGFPSYDDVTFLEILLKNSPVLETVEFNSTSRGWNSKIETPNNLPQKLQALPRASPSVTFLLIQPQTDYY